MIEKDGVIHIPGTDDPETEAANLELAKHCTAALLKWYPQHPWMVNVDLIGGVINVFHPLVSSTHCYTLVPKGWTDGDGLGRELRQAGGEILERGGLKRGTLTLQEYKDRQGL